MDMPVQSPSLEAFHKEYNQHIENLYRWFVSHMLEPGVKPIVLTHVQYMCGTDFLPDGPMKNLVTMAYKIWSEDRHYALSPTEQMDIAFFRAANDLNKITIVG